MKVSQLLVAGAALSVSSVSAELATFSPITGITYNVGIPSTTRSAGSGDIFISVSFPARYQWVGIGIGTHMAGASLFVSYTDGQGNVTVSPRDGLGEFMPLLNPEKEVTILAGSKADKDTVLANFRYKATAAELEMQSEQAPWIGSWKTGSPFDTTNRAQVLTQHDDFRMYSLDLASADVGTSQNPFLDEGPVQPVNTGTQLGSGESMYAKFEKAHGSLMGTAWLVVLPIGSIMMRLRWGGVWTHVGIQVLGTLTIIAGFGVGRTLAERKQLLFNNTHTVFGATIFALILVQPFLGMIHHALYMRDGQRTPIGTAHCWYGRAVMILAAVNGGLGLQLAGNTKGGEIAWGVVAGVMLLAYLAASAYRARDDRTREKEVAREA